MERRDRPGVITLFAHAPFADGDTIHLQGGPVQHARARRVTRGTGAHLLDGRGRVGRGEVAALGKDEVVVNVLSVETVARPTPLAVIVPVADRDRMLMAAEKCVELQATEWRPAYYTRSRSVSSRGEGPKFLEKVRARMESALEQSGGAWMPDIHPEVEAADAFGAISADWTRLILDSRGTSIKDRIVNGAMAIAIGPEGGFEEDEMAAAQALGWLPASLGHTTLRFETAVIAAAAVVRSHQG